jgi:23S rRNA (cytidine1920-2'-O)/16S rRNA (cytidine1409-2'-O)-methyltransferase
VTPKKIRIDELLVARGLAPSLELARAFVMEGKVLASDQRVDKPSVMVPEQCEVRLRDQAKYVSRGGDKLEGALLDLGLTAELRDATVLDIGASTGGFSDCCLAFGAKQIVAVEMGNNQLDWKLRNDPKVICLERCDIRLFDGSAYPKFNWVVADISFNPLVPLLPFFRKAAPGKGVHFLVLVKPQFELEAHEIGDGGIVKEPALRQQAVEKVAIEFGKLGLSGGRAIASRLEGQKGNQEIFYYVRS